MTLQKRPEEAVHAEGMLSVQGFGFGVEGLGFRV